MKKDKIFWVVIFSILIITSYMGFIFNEKIEIGILKEIKNINKILLCIFTFLFISNKKKGIEEEIKIILIFYKKYKKRC